MSKINTRKAQTVQNYLTNVMKGVAKQNTVIFPIFEYKNLLIFRYLVFKEDSALVASKILGIFRIHQADV